MQIQKKIGPHNGVTFNTTTQMVAIESITPSIMLQNHPLFFLMEQYNRNGTPYFPKNPIFNIAQKLFRVNFGVFMWINPHVREIRSDMESAQNYGGQLDG